MTVEQAEVLVELARNPGVVAASFGMGSNVYPPPDDGRGYVLLRGPDGQRDPAVWLLADGRREPCS